MFIEIKEHIKKKKKSIGPIEITSLIPKKDKKLIKKRKFSKKDSGRLIVPITSEELEGRSPRGIVKKVPTEDEFMKHISTEVGFLNSLTETDGIRTELFEYQKNWLSSRSRFKFIAKSRRVGASFCFASEGLAKSHLRKKHKALYISYNLEESSDKVACARELYWSLPTEWQKKLVVDNKHSLEFESPDGKFRSTLISFPQRQPRGKGADVYLDELAHYMYDHVIWAAALPVISVGRQRWVLGVGSTPFGDKGVFREIYVNDHDRYNMFRCRIVVNWWNCPSLCNNVERAQELAPSMKVEERVYEFGNPVLVSIYNAMPEEDFRQEYEILFIGELSSFFSVDTIRMCVFPEDCSLSDVDPDSYEEIRYPIVDNNRGIFFKRYDSLEELVVAQNKGIIKNRLVGGYDVGRKIDKSELKIFEEIPLTSNTFLVERFSGTYANCSFEQQKNTLREFIKATHLKLGIDANGIGANLAEDLYREFPSQVVEVHTTGEWKGRAVSDLKIRFEGLSIAIQDDRDTIRQIHSIKKKITETGNVTFISDSDNTKSTKHHADKFWSIALASSIAEKPYKVAGRVYRRFSDDEEFVDKKKNTKRLPITIPGSGKMYLEYPNTDLAVGNFQVGGFIKDYI